MSSEPLSNSKNRTLKWNEQSITVRGCELSLNDIKDVYLKLTEININFGKTLVDNLQRNVEMDENAWHDYKNSILSDAFRLTITIVGSEDQIRYGESSELFDDPNLPKPIKSIYFTNITAFRRNANDELPKNEISVLLDFDKPEIFDPNPLVSAATPNPSHVRVRATDATFFLAVQNVAQKYLVNKKNWYSLIHRNFAYDFGMWFLALPAFLFLSAYYMDLIVPVGGKFELYRWPLFVYLCGFSLVIYRMIAAYAKWAFPVNVLLENKDKAWRHRPFLGLILTGLTWEVVSTLFSKILS